MAQRDRDVLKPSWLWALASALAVLLGFAGPVVAAERQQAVLLPSSVEVAPDRYTPASASDDARVRKLGAELDDTVREGLEDLGLLPLPSAPGTSATDAALTAVLQPSWVFAPRLTVEGDEVHVRVVAIAPGTRVALVRQEDFSSKTLGTLDVRTVVLLRDLFDVGKRKNNEPSPRARPSRFEPPSAPPSSGRALLALNGALYGGFVGFTIEKASGSSDVRLVYPLVALGTGLGIGASLLVADEWNITPGDAWYLTASLWWPAASGFLLADAYGAKPDDRYAYALLGASAGLTLGVVSLSMHHVSEGDAVVTHSGGAVGSLFGAMTDAAIQGTLNGSVKHGIGWGAAAGVLVGGAVATQLEIGPSRALLIDLAAGLGTLGGAALASPLLLVDDSSPERTRLWLASAALGTVAGGVVGWYATAGSAKSAPHTSQTQFMPYAGGVPSGKGMTVGVSGAF